MVATIVRPASASTLSFVTTASAMNESSPEKTEEVFENHLEGSGRTRDKWTGTPQAQAQEEEREESRHRGVSIFSHVYTEGQKNEEQKCLAQQADEVGSLLERAAGRIRGAETRCRRTKSITLGESIWEMRGHTQRRCKTTCVLQHSYLGQ